MIVVSCLHEMGKESFEVIKRGKLHRFPVRSFDILFVSCLFHCETGLFKIEVSDVKHHNHRVKIKKVSLC